MLAFLNAIEDESIKSSLEILYRQYRSLLFKIAYDYLKNEALAEDAVQDAFLYAAKNFEKIDMASPQRTRNYLATIARCCAIKSFKHGIKAEMLKAKITELHKSEESSLEESYFNKITAQAAKDAINALDEKYKIPFYLKVIYDYKSKDIAELLGISGDCARQHIFTARKLIKERLEKEAAV